MIARKCHAFDLKLEAGKKKCSLCFELANESWKGKAEKRLLRLSLLTSHGVKPFINVDEDAQRRVLSNQAPLWSLNSRRRDCRASRNRNYAIPIIRVCRDKSKKLSRQASILSGLWCGARYTKALYELSAKLHAKELIYYFVFASSGWVCMHYMWHSLCIYILLKHATAASGRNSRCVIQVKTPGKLAMPWGETRQLITTIGSNNSRAFPGWILRHNDARLLVFITKLWTFDLQRNL